MFQREVRIGTTLALLYAALLLLFGILAALTNTAMTLAPPWDAALGISTFFATLAYYAFLFVALPQNLLLRRMGVTSGWAFFLVGLISGGFFALIRFIGADWLAFAHHSRAALASLDFYFQVLAQEPQRLVATFHTRALSLSGYATLGGLIGWLWSMRTYRLPGDTPHDWDGKILAGRPPYAR